MVLNSIPSFVFWKDTDSIYQGCNLNFADYAGLNAPDEVIGKSDYDLPWSKEESDFFRKIDKEVMESGEAKINFEEPQTISDGSTRWVRTSKIPLKNIEGEVIGILGTYEDITERKKMELELLSSNTVLKDLNAKLETVNLDLEQFAYAVSHDLKEPIRMIGGFSGLLRKKYADRLDVQGNEYLDYLIEGATRMSKLVGQILVYSKLEKLEDQFVNRSFLDLLNEVLDELKIIIRDKNASVKVSVPNKKIKCQPERIKMLFHNLITNGIKFNTSTAPLIEINAEERAQEWYFQVADNGIGVEEEYRELIFKPFKRLDTRGKFPGSGIGLSICKRIIHLHEGELNCEGNNGNGSVFYFTIPKEYKA